jgi:dihydrofolate reductase
MGILRAMLFMSVDGVVKAPDAWHFAYFSPEMGDDLASSLDAAGAMILGRVTYDEFAAYWPNQPDDAPFATLNNTIRKYVVSSSLGAANWANTTIIKSDVARALTELKSQIEGDLHVTGSPTLVRWLLEQRLLDELKLQISPVLVGKGQQLFDASSATGSLRLTSLLRLPHDVLSLTYGCDVCVS